MVVYMGLKPLRNVCRQVSRLPKLSRLSRLWYWSSSLRWKIRRIHGIVEEKKQNYRKWNKCFFLHLKVFFSPNVTDVFYVDVHITDISDQVVKALDHCVYISLVWTRL